MALPTSYSAGDPYPAADHNAENTQINTNVTDIATINRGILFGGDGSDGALAITSGTTNIDLGGLSIVIKNYSSISITGTGELGFTNPHANGTIVILKCSGNFTLTSSANPAIDLVGIGAAALTQGVSYTEYSNFGTAGVTEPAAVGVGGAATTYPIISKGSRTYRITCGAGGGTGSNGETSGTGGAGGRGGGALILEVAGAYNITGIISAAGAAGADGSSPGAQNAGQHAGVGGGGGGNKTAGTNGSLNSGGDGSTQSSCAGGGGGGGGGSILIIYNTLTADSGTYTITGGAGGNGYDIYGGDGGAGGNGFSEVFINQEYT